jgi:hypothetical protein
MKKSFISYASDELFTLTFMVWRVKGTGDGAECISLIFNVKDTVIKKCDDR